MRASGCRTLALRLRYALYIARTSPASSRRGYPQASGHPLDAHSRIHGLTRVRQRAYHCQSSPIHHTYTVATIQKRTPHGSPVFDGRSILHPISRVRKASRRVPTVDRRTQSVREATHNERPARASQLGGRARLAQPSRNELGACAQTKRERIPNTTLEDSPG